MSHYLSGRYRSRLRRKLDGQILEGPGQAGQDQSGQDDGRRRQVDELLRPAKAFDPDSAGSTLPRS